MPCPPHHQVFLRSGSKSATLSATGAPVLQLEAGGTSRRHRPRREFRHGKTNLVRGYPPKAGLGPEYAFIAARAHRPSATAGPRTPITPGRDDPTPCPRRDRPAPVSLAYHAIGTTHAQRTLTLQAPTQSEPIVLSCARASGARTATGARQSMPTRYVPDQPRLVALSSASIHG